MRMLRLLPVLLLLAASEPALALRCGNKLVIEGDHKAKVLKHCGEPAAVQVRRILRAGIPRPPAGPIEQALDRRELLLHQRSWVEVLVEEWTYNFGPRKLMRVITFENGLVSRITQLGYGYRE
ncbi:MAG: DUF2845 domain-containing protein [Gammaproteobacteria bacterium]|nr:MAG: DUF2845 domain-containing protein [Gammaproteobacteria bacterium]